MTILEDLLARIEKATGFDYELGIAIEYAVLNGQHLSGSPVTGSIDAAVALVERVLPGWHWNIRTFSSEKATPKNGASEAIVRLKDWTEHCADATTPPLAICAALLKAKIAEESIPMQQNLKDKISP